MISTSRCSSRCPFPDVQFIVAFLPGLSLIAADALEKSELIYQIENNSYHNLFFLNQRSAGDQSFMIF